MIIILSGVSGVGKTTIAKLLEEHETHNFSRSISYTTRSMRAHEENHKDYIFITQEEFAKKINENFFLEHTKQFDNFYGTSYESIEKLLNEEKKTVMCLSKDGFEAACAKWPTLVTGVYLLPPEISVLERRLSERNANDYNSKHNLKDIDIRMNIIAKQTKNLEKEHDKYHHKITPDSIENTLQQILGIIEKKQKIKTL